MKRSFVRLVVTSVMLMWAAGLVAVVVYGRGLSWIDGRAQTDGVFFVHETLAQEPAEARAARLNALQPHFSVRFRLMPPDEVTARLGRPLAAHETAPLRIDAREEWYFLAFAEGESVLAAGPVNATRPEGFIPIGVIAAAMIVPVLAAMLALRVQRELTKVEHASDQLAIGELSARVDNKTGPSSELAASFNAMAERVEHLVRSREELVQAVSHELGSPLSRLRFHLELLGQASEDVDRVRAMERELDALDELVGELLRYVQSDEREVDHESFDPTPGLRDLAELAQFDGPEASDVQVDVAAESGASVHAERRLFMRAVENLLRNAVQHARSTVRLELTGTEDGVRVAVHDDGPGIAPAIRDKVTQPFYRPEGARDRKTGGVGLGLAIVSRIVTAHGGQLHIEDSPLGGAQVVTEWPAAV